MLYALAFYAFFALTTPSSPTEWLQRYDSVMGAQNFKGVFRMRAHREDGSERSYTFDVLKMGDDKTRISFQAPSSIFGQEILRQGDNFWIYMPNLKRAVRLASRESFQGGDFNNADVLRIHYETDYSATESTTTAPHTCSLDLRAKTSSAAYDHIQLMFDTNTRMPTAAEYYSQSGKMLRKAEFSDVRSFEGFERPARIVMTNMLLPSRNTQLDVLQFDIHAKPTSTAFVLDNLGVQF